MLFAARKSCNRDEQQAAHHSKPLVSVHLFVSFGRCDLVAEALEILLAGFTRLDMSALISCHDLYMYGKTSFAGRR
jgi:hypothetical protein